jgi:Ribonuclease BN-like family.
MIKSRLLALFYSLKEIFLGDVGLYASALTLRFLMVISSLLLFLGFLASFFPFLNQEKIMQVVSQLTPSYGEVLINKLLKIYKHREIGSIFSFLISYFFLVSYAKAFAKAISRVLKEDIKLKETLLWVFIPVYLLGFSFFIVVGSATLSLLQSFIPKSLSFTLGLSKPLLFLPLIYLMYWFFLRNTLKPLRILETSVLFLVFLTLLNFVFGNFFINLISLNPLYAVLGSLLSFLLWLELTFSFLLGAVVYAKKLR